MFYSSSVKNLISVKNEKYKKRGVQKYNRV